MIVSDAKRGIEVNLVRGNNNKDKYNPPGWEIHVLPCLPLPRF